MAKKLLAAVTLCFCLAGLVLTVVAFRVPDWVNWDDGTEDREFGLFIQTGGKDPAVIPAWYCNYIFY